MNQYSMCVQMINEPLHRMVDLPSLHDFDYNAVLLLDLSTQANAYPLVLTT